MSNWSNLLLYIEYVACVFLGTQKTIAVVRQTSTNTNVDDVDDSDRVRRILVDRRAPITLKI